MEGVKIELKSCYDFKEINENVIISKNKKCVISSCGQELEGNADVILRFLPRSRIEINFEYKCSSEFDCFKSSFNDCFERTLLINEKKIPVIATSISPSLSSLSVRLVLSPKEEPVKWIGDDNTEMTKVVFHLFNYKDTFGTGNIIDKGSDTIHLGILTNMESEDWIIEFQKKIDNSQTIKKLKENGGYGLTHVGCFYRKDNKSFDGKDALKLLSHLNDFFTFSRGTFCHIVLPVGFNENNYRVWEILNSPWKPWGYHNSWFDQRHCEQLSELFPKFLSKIQDEKWGKTLKKVIYWYARSNDSWGSGIDTGIILTQAAIERLSYEYLVNHKKMIDLDGFKRLKASDEFRLLFASLEIPLEIPLTLQNITELAKKLKYSDSPHALTEIRNSIVHPENEKKNEFDVVYYEAWSLGLWYLELAILKLCDYNGTYINRLSEKKYVGSIENVPWIK